MFGVEYSPSCDPPIPLNYVTLFFSDGCRFPFSTNYDDDAISTRLIEAELLKEEWEGVAFNVVIAERDHDPLWVV